MKFLVLGTIVLLLAGVACSDPSVKTAHTYTYSDEYAARPASDNPHFQTWCEQADVIAYELHDGITFREYEIRIGDATDKLARIAPELGDAAEGTWRLVGTLRWIEASTHTTLDELDAATRQFNSLSLDRDVEACKAQGVVSETLSP